MQPGSVKAAVRVLEGIGDSYIVFFSVRAKQITDIPCHTLHVLSMRRLARSSQAVEAVICQLSNMYCISGRLPCQLSLSTEMPNDLESTQTPQFWDKQDQ